MGKMGQLVEQCRKIPDQVPIVAAPVHVMKDIFINMVKMIMDVSHLGSFNSWIVIVIVYNGERHIGLKTRKNSIAKILI